MTDNGDNTKVWVYGKDGWYVAKWLWDAAYAKHLEELGYDVRRAVNSPALSKD